MKKARLFILVVCFAAASAYAQEPAAGPPPPPMRPPGFGRAGLLGFEGMHGGPVVKGAPYSATAVSETTQMLSDGSHIKRTATSALYRDEQGRVRREVTLPAIGPWATSGEPSKFISISDPVAGARYILNPNKKTAMKMTGGPGWPSPAGMHGGGPGGPDHGPWKGRDSSNETTESLGTKEIDGLAAEGARVTRTIPAGEIGNDKPILIVSERWFSKDLQIVVMIKRSDPFMGETTYKLTHIQRLEPAATLFQVPADYTVKEGGMGRKGMRMHMHHGAPGGPPPEGASPPAQP